MYSYIKSNHNTVRLNKWYQRQYVWRRDITDCTADRLKKVKQIHPLIFFSSIWKRGPCGDGLRIQSITLHLTSVRRKISRTTTLLLRRAYGWLFFNDMMDKRADVSSDGKRLSPRGKLPIIQSRIALAKHMGLQKRFASHSISHQFVFIRYGSSNNSYILFT